MSKPTMIDAMKLIVSKSPTSGSEAIKTMQAIHAKSPILQLRYNRTVEMALNDREATFTPDERALLALFVDVISDPDEMSSTLPAVRCSDVERTDIEERARSAGMNLSAYIRSVLFTS
jgi:DNA replication initiation complex subunit (GINS family)